MRMTKIHEMFSVFIHRFFFFFFRLKEAARETAKRAKELAQEKAGPIYAACEGVKS